MQQQPSFKLKLLKWAVVVIAIGVVLNYNTLAGWFQEELDRNMYLVQRPVAVWHQTMSQMKALARNIFFLGPAETGRNDSGEPFTPPWSRQGSHQASESEYQVTVDQNGSRTPQDTGKDDVKNDGGSFVYNGAKDNRPDQDNGASTPQPEAAVPRSTSAAQDYSVKDTADFYHRQAREGDAGAQFDLANMYYTGNGMEKNYNEAAGWYRKAADHGVVPAQVALGSMYYNGEGVDRDYIQAVKYWRKAAEAGNSDAELNLANAYHEGKGVPKDDTEAVKWWGLAADRGNAEAQQMLKKYAPEAQ